LSNAIKFSNKSETITVVIESAEFQDEQTGDNFPSVRLSFEDNGVIIPESELKTVFNKFIQSTQTNTHAGGTGLGLAIAKEIIDKHKGKIWAESSAEKGTRFCFELPLASGK